MSTLSIVAIIYVNNCIHMGFIAFWNLLINFKLINFSTDNHIRKAKVLLVNLGLLVDFLVVNCSLRQYFGLYRAVSQKERENGKGS